MKLKIPCFHAKGCHKKEHSIEFQFPDICGISGCDKVAQCIIQEGNVFYKVCLIHGQGKKLKHEAKKE